MKKQTFFLVALIFFAFVLSSWVNAMPKVIEKRDVCPELTYHCRFVPAGTLDKQVLGELKFQQQPDCSVWLDGQLNQVIDTTLYSDYDPGWKIYEPESEYYDVKIVDSVGTLIWSLNSFLYPIRIEAPFAAVVPSPGLGFPFTKLKGKLCTVIYNCEDGPVQQPGETEVVEIPN
ncbi:11862_t:CDS:1 [Ambispora gerdemannii]|uniref:11862_t:CDS:1 n=1 Tax=Ambispora gerdemannii TaxID=144530 RepID=A0A9N9AWL4_9GLOM|nr:11862_t:CDS:1 [Ambispora gerdemannii]